MSTVKLIALACRISRGAFSDERVFEIDLPGKDEPYVGAASRQYCWSQDNKKLAEDEPPEGKTIQGKIAARFVGMRDGLAVVSIPDGEVIAVKSEQILARPPEPTEHVPV